MKYSREELRGMARAALHAQHAEPAKWFDLIARLFYATGVRPREAEALIRRMASAQD